MGFFGYSFKKSSPSDLQQLVPSATDAECRRFYSTYGREAEAKLRAYLEWRATHHLDAADTDDSRDSESSGSDEEFPLSTKPCKKKAAPKTGELTQQRDRKFWEDAVQGSILQCLVGREVPGEITDEDILGESSRFRSRKSDGPPSVPKLKNMRQVMYAPHFPATGAPAYDVKGHRILYHCAGRVNINAASPEFYAETIALYADNYFDRDDDSKISVYVDCRPHKNWPSVNALSLIGFVRVVANHIHHLNPNRLHQCVLFPVPRAAVYMWKIISHVLDANLRNHVVLVPGSDSASAPMPYEAMEQYASLETLQLISATHARAIAESKNMPERI